MKTLDQLIDMADPGWPVVQSWLAQATNPVEVLPVDAEQASQTLLCLQVTTRSPMGAIAYSSGGLLFDHGWLRVLGSGSDRLPRTLASWNGLGLDKTIESHRLPGGMLVADDLVGGFFALNGGAFSAQLGHIQYFAPDTLDWQDTRMTYSQFLMWMCTGDLVKFYESCRWPGWKHEAQSVSGDRAMSVYPFLWTGGSPIVERARRPVPVEQLWGLQMDM